MTASRLRTLWTVLLAGSLLWAMPARAAPVPRAAASPAPEAEAALQAGLTRLIQQGKYREALPLAQQAVAAHERRWGPAHAQVARSLGILGQLLHALADLPGARDALERSVSTWEQASGPTRHYLARALQDLADVHAALGDEAAAWNAASRALKLSEEEHGAVSLAVADSLTTFGRVARNRGDLVTARMVFERALAVLERIYGPEQPYLAVALSNLGETVAGIGDLAAARPLLQRALDLAERQGEQAGDTSLVAGLNLGKLLLLMGETEAARPLLQRGHVLVEKHADREPLRAARYLNALAEVERARGDLPAARSLLERGLAMLERLLGSRHHDVGIYLLELATLLREQGQPEAALPRSQRALAILQETSGPNHPTVASALQEVALDTWRQGDLDAARRSLLLAVDNVESHLASPLGGLSFAEQRLFLEHQLPRYRSLLLSTCRKGGPLRDAYYWLYRWKGLLLEALHRHGQLARLQGDPRLREPLRRLHALRAELAAWYQQAGAVPDAEWRRRSQALTTEKEQLERDLARAASSREEDPVWRTSSYNVDQTLRPGEAFLDMYRYEYWQEGRFVEERFATVILAPGVAPALVDLGRADLIEGAVAAWRRAVTAGGDAALEWSRLLDLVWKPLAAGLPDGADRLWLSPDGELARVPWHLMVRKSGQGREFLLAQIDSLRELARLRQRATPVFDSPNVLLVGGLDFGPGDFPPLPGTAAEVRALAEVAGRAGVRSTVLSRDQAAKASLIAAMPGANYVHLATHGFFAREPALGPATRGVVAKMKATPWPASRWQDGRNPLVESGLALSGFNNRDPARLDAAGVLTAEELIGLNLGNSQLVTLSACDTGRGEEVTGQGVLGLRAAIMSAGARAVLMSLWQVPDEATMLLMQAFYRHLWLERLTESEALLRAQAEIRDHPSGRFKAPLYWAGWVLAGDVWR